MTSVFGSGREFNGTITSRHVGTDHAGAVGAPVHAANRGVVRLVDSFFLGGNVVSCAQVDRDAAAACQAVRRRRV